MSGKSFIESTFKLLFFRLLLKRITYCNERLWDRELAESEEFSLLSSKMMLMKDLFYKYKFLLVFAHCHREYSMTESGQVSRHER